jgi:urea transport system ATP-binding protein
VFENLSVFENLELALKMDRGTFATLLARLDGTARRRIDDMLGLIGLGAERGRSAAALSHGQKQWLEIGMLLLTDPQLLLLDEPVAGMTDVETEQTAALFKDLAGSHTLVVVEHDMQFVRELGVRVTVLHEGSVLAEGSLDHVQKDQRVVDVYLGR